jgi:hypothetical protein
MACGRRRWRGMQRMCMSAAGGEDVDGRRGMHCTSRNIMKREQPHI